nr:fanconi-associated nuclease 1 [Pogona vitticeps]
MAEEEPPENKRPRKSTSLSRAQRRAASRRDGPDAKGGLPLSPSPSSILSFFNNVPPARITCPLCGEMVPRYGINRHIDEVCEKGRDNDVILVASSSALVAEEGGPGVSSPYFTKNASGPEKSPSRASGGERETEARASERTSPYFKKGSRLVLSDGEPGIRAVKSISLGSLSARLSRRRHRAQGEGVLAQSAEGHSAQDVWDDPKEANSGEATSEGGSQKENRLPLAELQRQHGRKEGGTSCGSGILSSDLSQSIPESSSSEGPTSGALGLFVKGSGQQGNPVSDLEKPDVCPAADNKAGDSALETRTLLELAPLSETREKSHHHQKPSFSLVGDVEEAPPLEEPKDLSNERTDDACLEKVSLEHPRGSVLEKVPNGPGPESDSQGHPYYLQNFLMVLHAVLENEDDRRLFDEQDLGIVDQFYQLSVGGQKLYVRLFQRKLNWIKTNKIEYPEISQDLCPVLAELVQARFLESEAELRDLPEVLDLLSAPELKTLAKAFHLKNPNAQKQQLLEDFLTLAKQRSFFSRSQAGVGGVILKRAKDLAGKSVRVCKGPRAVFSRVLLLFSLSDPMEDEEAGSGGQGQLSTVLMVNMGRMVFPAYTVERRTPIFQDRDDFIRYATAAHMSNDISVAMVNGNWKGAHKLYETAREMWQELQHHPSLRLHAALPEYLRRFTVGWVYTRILSRGVEILQRLHMYEEAVEQLQDLLGQEVYCTDSRGRWWDRLALNLHQHLKDTEKAVGCIRKGLQDPFVRTGHRLSLSQRAQRMKELPACKRFRPLLQDLPLFPVEDVVHVTIKGKLCPQTGMGKSVFIVDEVDHGENLEPSTAVCCVEELALAHYRQCGFDQGMHGEGSTFSTLYGLLMWEILFMDGIPDVFRNPYQAFPLDLYTDSFYENRQLAIESRLQSLHEASPETLMEWIAEVWEAQEGKVAALISWDRFSSLQQAQSLARCLGGPFLSGVFRRFSKDLRHYRGGLPDLVVWRTEDHQFKLVEVKGPNDRLSHKQMLWLAELQKLGAPVEVCHVVAVGSKSQRWS